jgi:1-acyl-sn-glycerol-3-phosphate acyltransferase
MGTRGIADASRPDMEESVASGGRRKQREFSLGHSFRWVRQWVPFGVRTAAYGAVSLTLGPLTREHGASTWAMKEWAKSALAGLKIEVDTRGADRLPSGGFVYAANHQSLIDILVLAAVLPGDFKWVAKQSLMKVPVLGWHLALSGHVGVERAGERKTAVDAITKFVEVLTAGKPLLIFPEGTRSRDGNLKTFKNGGFHAALRADVPVVPVMLDGTYSLMSKEKASMETPKGSPVRVRLGHPIYPGDLPEGTERASVLNERAHQAVRAMLDGP